MPVISSDIFQLSSIDKYTIINSQTLEDFNLHYLLKLLQNVQAHFHSPFKFYQMLPFRLKLNRIQYVVNYISNCVIKIFMLYLKSAGIPFV